MALGARRGDVVWLVVREALLLVAIGIAVGVPAALVVARLASSQIAGLLFGLEATDPFTIVGGGVRPGVGGGAARRTCPRGGRRASIRWWRCERSNRLLEHPPGQARPEGQRYIRSADLQVGPDWPEGQRYIRSADLQVGPDWPEGQRYIRSADLQVGPDWPEGQRYVRSADLQVGRTGLEAGATSAA